MEKLLKDIGLSNGEIKVYLAVLNLGNAPVQKIHEKTRIERRNIYDILNKLIERGLVNYIGENKKRYFKVSHPQKIINYLEEKQESIESIKEKVTAVMSSIIEKFNANKLEVNAEIYRGSEGIKTVWNDMLKEKEIRWIGSGNYVPNKLPEFFEQWSRKRIEKKIRSLHLFRNEIKDQIIKKSFQEGKILPKEFSGNPTVIAIYGNKVVNFLFGETLFAFVIDSKELAENYKKYHQYLWDNIAE